MSIVATEEPPVQVQTQATPTPEERKAAAAEMLRPKVRVDGITSQAPEPIKKVEEVPKVEATKTEETKVIPPVDPKEQSIAELRKSRDEERKQREELQKGFEAAKAERDKLVSEFEEYKKKPASEDFLKKHQELEAERNKLDQELRAAALERSPSFRKEFADRINQNATAMVDLMVGSGMERAEAVRAINTWNEDTFASVSEGMTTPQKIKFQAAWMEAERIESARKAALADADNEYKKRETAQQEQQKSQMDQHQQFLKSEEETMFKELFQTEGLKENAELQKAAREAVAASYQMQPRELMHRIATSRILADAVIIKEKQLTDLRAEHETLKTQLAEQAEFIKNAKAGVAHVSPTDAAATPEDKKARANAFLNPTVRG